MGSSVAVLAGLSELARASGYMEMELDTIFEPQRMLGGLRTALGPDFPVVAIADDAYSDALHQRLFVALSGLTS